MHTRILKFPGLIWDRWLIVEGASMQITWQGQAVNRLCHDLINLRQKETCVRLWLFKFWLVHLQLVHVVLAVNKPAANVRQLITWIVSADWNPWGGWGGGGGARKFLRNGIIPVLNLVSYIMTKHFLCYDLWYKDFTILLKFLLTFIIWLFCGMAFQIIVPDVWFSAYHISFGKVCASCIFIWYCGDVCYYLQTVVWEDMIFVYEQIRQYWLHKYIVVICFICNLMISIW